MASLPSFGFPRSYPLPAKDPRPRSSPASVVIPSISGTPFLLQTVCQKDNPPELQGGRCPRTGLPQVEVQQVARMAGNRVSIPWAGVSIPWAEEGVCIYIYVITIEEGNDIFSYLLFIFLPRTCARMCVPICRVNQGSKAFGIFDFPLPTRGEFLRKSPQ
jgi:hypothetical protein